MKSSRPLLLLGLALLAATGLVRAGAPPAASPVFNPTGPEAATFGQAAGFPVGDPDTWQKPAFLVGTYTHFAAIFPTHRIPRAESPSPFLRAAAEPSVRYEFKGRSYDLNDYLAHFPVTGFLVLKGDTILMERYQYGRTAADPFTSNSMAKSIMALLTGVAVGEGKIHSVDDKVSAYVPALRGSVYGDTSLRAVLQMSSGVNFDYDAQGHPGPADSIKLLKGLFAPSDQAAGLAPFSRRFPVSTKFHYSGGDSLAVGLALHQAIGRTLSEYLAEKIWRPMGAEADASWATDTAGQEFTFYGFNAVLRDWARLGRLMANDGAWNGKQLIPSSWLKEATTLRPVDRQVAAGTATPYFGYGYQIWILPGARRMFVLRGSDSQYVFVDPSSKLVWVQTALRSEAPHAEDGQSEALAVWLALVRDLGK